MLFGYTYEPYMQLANRTISKKCAGIILLRLSLRRSRIIDLLYIYIISRLGLFRLVYAHI